MYIVPTRRNYDITPQTSLEEIAREHAPLGWENLFTRTIPQLRLVDEVLQSYTDGGEIITPPRHEIFEAFYSTPLPNVRVVIIGQDPYTGVARINGENYPIACGLSFSVREGCQVPPSLQNIFKELKNTVPGFYYRNGDLRSWTTQGVMLLNSCLTVSLNSNSGGHTTIWNPFVQEAVREINAQRPNTLFVLWGRKAQQFVSSIPIKYKLMAGHPSTLNRANYSASSSSSFLGCNHFNLINEYLQFNKEKNPEGESEPIDWSII